MKLPIPSCLEDLSNEDILDIAWEPEFLDQLTPLEQLLLQRLGEQSHMLNCALEECRRLAVDQWTLC
jgi:hypothetical protein